MKYTVDIIYDSEASVWIATSKDVKELIFEHDSYEGLEKKVIMALPELLELNNYPKATIVSFKSERELRLIA